MVRLQSLSRRVLRALQSPLRRHRPVRRRPRVSLSLRVGLSPHPRARLGWSALAALTLGVVVSGCASGPWWQNLTADQVWQRGSQQFADEDWGDAAETLSRLLLQFPSFAQADEAQFMLAEAYFEDEQYISAQSEFTRFIDRYPTHARAPEAAIAVCRANRELSPISQRDQTFTLQAIQVCQNVTNDWFGTPQAVEAARIVNEMRGKLARKIWDNGWYYHRRSLLDPALIYYEDLIENYPDTEYAPRALKGMAEIYTIFGYDEEAAEARDQLFNSYPDSPEAEEVREAEAAKAEAGERGAEGGSSGDVGPGGTGLDDAERGTGA